MVQELSLIHIYLPVSMQYQIVKTLVLQEFLHIAMPVFAFLHVLLQLKYMIYLKLYSSTVLPVVLYILKQMSAVILPHIETPYAEAGKMCIRDRIMAEYGMWILTCGKNNLNFGFNLCLVIMDTRKFASR